MSCCMLLRCKISCGFVQWYYRISNQDCSHQRHDDIAHKGYCCLTMIVLKYWSISMLHVMGTPFHHHYHRHHKLLYSKSYSFDMLEWHQTNNGPFTNCCSNFIFDLNISPFFKSSVVRSIVFSNDILCNSHINPVLALKLIRIQIFEPNLLIIGIYIINSLIFFSFYYNFYAIFLHYIIILIKVIIITFVVHRYWMHDRGFNIRGLRTRQDIVW